MQKSYPRMRVGEHLSLQKTSQQETSQKRCFKISKRRMTDISIPHTPIAKAFSPRRWLATRLDVRVKHAWILNEYISFSARKMQNFRGAFAEFLIACATSTANASTYSSNRRFSYGNTARLIILMIYSFCTHNLILVSHKLWVTTLSTSMSRTSRSLSDSPLLVMSA